MRWQTAWPLLVKLPPVIAARIRSRPPITVSVLVLTASLSWLALVAMTLGPLPLFDLNAAMHGGLDWVRGVDPYIKALNDPGTLVTSGSGFVYPPSTLPVFALMAYVGDVAVKAWQVAGLVALGWLVCDASIPRSARRLAALAIVAAFFYPAVTNLVIGQPGLITMGAAWLSICLLDRRSDRIAGAALAVASFAKLFPLLELLLFAFRRRIRGVIAAIAVMSVFVLLPMPFTESLWPEYITGVLLQKGAVANAFPTSQSIVALCSRLMTNNPFEASLVNAAGVAHIVGGLVSVLVFGAVAFYARRYAQSNFRLAAAMMLAVLPLTLPHSWQHYHVLALPLLLLLINDAMLRRDWPLGIVALVAFILMSIVPALMDRNLWSVSLWPVPLQAIYVNSTVLGTCLLLAAAIFRLSPKTGLEAAQPIAA